MSQHASSLLLLSAGVESTTLLHLVQDQRPLALFVDYGQRAAAREYACAQWQCQVLGLALKRFDLASLGAAFRAEQVHKLHVPIPHRNLLVLALAVCFAEQRGASTLYLGLNREDAETQPSAGPAFVAQFQALAATLGAVRLQTPLIGQRKPEIVALGRRHGVDFAHTYSCLLGHARHCGACPQCRHRRRAFQEAGSPEPEDFYRSR